MFSKTQLSNSVKILENEQKPTFTGGFVNLGRSRTQGPAMPPLVFWEIHDFPKHVQNINNVLPYNH